MEQSGQRRCGAISLADGSVCWRVWAPLAKQVQLILVNRNSRRVCPMTPHEHGYFSYTEAGIAEGQRYAYRLDGGPERPDPASRWQPDGVHQPSAVLKPENFAWSDSSWTSIAREELVFYELHVGTFTPEGSFEAVIPRLPALRDLGVTAVELMPVAQFPGTRNWGYDGVDPYAPQNSYGGPHGLQRLVDACHAHGLAIFLDVVYNHLGPEGSYFDEFGPYHTDHYHTAWGRAINYDDRGSDEVRSFVLENVRMWIEDYHFDGLRLDAVHAIYDLGARHILRDIKEAAQASARRRKCPIYIVAESDLNDVRLLRPPEAGGYGIDAQWSDDFHHTVHAYLTGERDGYYADFGDRQSFPKLFKETFVIDGRYSEHRGRTHGAPAGLTGDHFVVCIQNHDQIGNRPAGERLGTLIGPAAQRLAASLLLLAPHLPLLFMGEEYGEQNPFQFFCSFSDASLVESVRGGRRKEFESFHQQFGKEIPDPQSETTFNNSRLSWSWQEQPHKAGLRRLYQELLHTRRSWPALRSFWHRKARLLSGEQPDTILELLRREEAAHDGERVQIYFNLAPASQAWRWPADLELLWCSESERYNGQRRSDKPRDELLPYECVVFGPANWQSFLS